MLSLPSVQQTHSCSKTSWEGAKKNSSQWHGLPKGKTNFTNCEQHSSAFLLCCWLCWGQQRSSGPEGRRGISSGKPSPKEILDLSREEQKSCDGSEKHLLIWDTKTLFAIMQSGQSMEVLFVFLRKDKPLSQTCTLPMQYWQRIFYSLSLLLRDIKILCLNEDYIIAVHI